MVKPTSYKVVWNIEALGQLKEILEYLEKQSNQAPKIVKQAVLEKIKVIKINPLICESDKLKRPSFDKEFRAFVVYSYRISYQIKIDIKEVRILRVRHCSREPLGY
jgi:plasmid stabilization system protein ParE